MKKIFFTLLSTLASVVSTLSITSCGKKTTESEGWKNPTSTYSRLNYHVGNLNIDINLPDLFKSKSRTFEEYKKDSLFRKLDRWYSKDYKKQQINKAIEFKFPIYYADILFPTLRPKFLPRSTPETPYDKNERVWSHTLLNVLIYENTLSTWEKNPTKQYISFNEFYNISSPNEFFNFHLTLRDGDDVCEVESLNKNKTFTKGIFYEDAINSIPNFSSCKMFGAGGKYEYMTNETNNYDPEVRYERSKKILHSTFEQYVNYIEEDGVYKLLYLDHNENLDNKKQNSL